MHGNCDDPTCPIHGSSPEAVALREARKEITVNEEMMNVIRIIACNTHQEILNEAAAQGEPPRSVDLAMMRAVISGDYDSDPIVQGIVKGLTVLLTGSHEPTKKFLTDCAEIKEPFIVARLMAAQREKDREKIPTNEPLQVGPFKVFTSFEQMEKYFTDQERQDRG